MCTSKELEESEEGGKKWMMMQSKSRKETEEGKNGKEDRIKMRWGGKKAPEKKCESKESEKTEDGGKNGFEVTEG